MPECQMPWITTVIAGAFTLGGVWLGNFLNQKNSYNQAHKQKMRDLRISSYAKLMGLKIPLTQVVQTNCEAKILCEYYYARFHLTGDNFCFEEAKKQNERALSLIPEVSKLRRELAEVIGEINIAFPISDKLKRTLHDVYMIPSINILEIQGVFPTVDKLEEWKKLAFSVLLDSIKNQYTNKIEALITNLDPLTDKAC